MNSSRTDKDIVLSSRIRLARNLSELNFTTTWTAEEKEKLELALYREITENPDFEDFLIYKIDDLDELDRIVLKEKKIISERYYRHGNGLVITDVNQCASIVSGDLDHLRISAVYDGLSIKEAYERASDIDKILKKSGFDFAVSDEEGYLTVNVSDSGTAMKGSVYLHLPCLCAAELMDHYIINTIETMLEVTGFSGGGAHSLGGLYLISNKNSFFPNEEHLAELLITTAAVLIEKEREVRDDLLNGKYPGLEDKIFRSLGILKYCRQISEQEAVSALSMVRLGAAVNWIEDLPINKIDSIFGIIGNGYLRSFAYESNPDETEIMRLRASGIRKNLNLKL